MIFCLPKNLVDTFLGKLKSGEINPEKLADMTSKERNEYFASFLGANNASKVNALFESKLLLKNQQQGIINWARQVSGLKPDVQRDLISRVRKMDAILQPKDMDSFLADLAAQRLGMGVTMEEAGKIADLAKTVSEKKALIPETSPIGSKERMEYGTALVVFKDYVGGLKAEAVKPTMRELLTNPGQLLDTIGGTMKSLAASLDDSFFGRQGFRALIEKPDMWMKNFIKSFGDMGKELKGVDAMTPIKAEIFSRPNALNGKYKAIGLDIGLTSEEAFPSQLPEKIPLFNKIYKASESAFNGGALRTRADLADAWLREAEANGVDVMNKEEGIGEAVNSLTGRGKVNLFSAQGNKVINSAIFSIKYLKSNLDALAAPAQYAMGAKKGVGSFARKKAAQNVIKTIGAIAGVLAVSKFLDPDSVELDPRSSKFGKIWVGKNHEIAVNISLGLAAIVTLASRVLPTEHNGKWGGWIKNSRGRYVNWWDGKFGQANGSDLIFNFMKGKASPIAGMLLNYFEAKNRNFEKPTLGGSITTGATPIPVQNMYQLAQTSAGEDLLLYGILTALDLIGVSVNPQTKKRR